MAALGGFEVWTASQILDEQRKRTVDAAVAAALGTSAAIARPTVTAATASTTSPPIASLLPPSTFNVSPSRTAALASVPLPPAPMPPAVNALFLSAAPLHESSRAVGVTKHGVVGSSGASSGVGGGVTTSFSFTSSVSSTLSGATDTTAANNITLTPTASNVLSAAGAAALSLSPLIVAPASTGASSSSSAAPDASLVDLVAIKSRMLSHDSLYQAMQRLERRVAVAEERVEMAEEERDLHARNERRLSGDLVTTRAEVESLASERDRHIDAIKILQDQNGMLLAQLRERGSAAALPPPPPPRPPPSSQVDPLAAWIPSRNELDESRAAVATANQRIASLESSLESASRSRADLEEKYAESKTKFKKQFATMQAMCTKALEVVKQTKATVGQDVNQEQRAAMQTAVRDQAARIVELEKQLVARDERVRALETQLQVRAVTGTVAPSADATSPPTRTRGPLSIKALLATRHATRGRPKKDAVPLPVAPPAPKEVPLRPSSNALPTAEEAMRQLLAQEEEDRLAPFLNPPPAPAAPESAPNTEAAHATPPSAPSTPPAEPTPISVPAAAVVVTATPKDAPVASVLPVAAPKRRGRPPKKRPAEEPPAAPSATTNKRARSKYALPTVTTPIIPPAAPHASSQLELDLFGEGHEEADHVVDEPDDALEMELFGEGHEEADLVRTADAVPPTTKATSSPDTNLTDVLVAAVAAEWSESVETLCEDTPLTHHPVRLLLPILCARIRPRTNESLAPPSTTGGAFRICSSLLPTFLHALLRALLSAAVRQAAQTDDAHEEREVIALSSSTSTLVTTLCAQFATMVRRLTDVTTSSSEPVTNEADADDNDDHAPAACSCAATKSDLSSAMYDLVYSALMRADESTLLSTEDAAVECGYLTLLLTAPPPGGSSTDIPSSAAIFSRRTHLLVDLMCTRRLVPLHLVEHLLAIAPEGASHPFQSAADDESGPAAASCSHEILAPIGPLPAPTFCAECIRQDGTAAHLLSRTLRLLLAQLLAPYPEEMVAMRLPHVASLLHPDDSHDDSDAASAAAARLCATLVHALLSVEAASSTLPVLVSALQLLLAAFGRSQTSFLVRHVFRPHYDEASKTRHGVQQQVWKYIIECASVQKDT